MALKKIGALWKKNGKKGEFFSGTLDLGVLGNVHLAIFRNDDKEGNQPDFTIHLMEMEDDLVSE